MAGTAFLSYSRKDRRLRDELVPMLRTVAVVRDRLWFDEQGIQVGDKFDPKIQQALAEAQAALLLVSKNFLDLQSAYIREHELPFILRRYQEGELQLGILYVSSVAADSLSIDWHSRDAAGTTDLLAIHSFNTPETPLDDVADEGARNKIYAKVADWLARQLASACQQAGQRLARLAATALDGRRPELAISLSRQRDHWLLRHYLPTQPTPLRYPGAGLGLDERQPDEVDGETLFTFLFGSDPDAAGHLFAAAFASRDRVEPTHSPLRLHLITDKPVLLALPWSEIAYRGRPLCDDGWTVELHSRSTDQPSGFPAHPDHVCYFPGRVLLAAAPTESSTRHCDDLRGFFQRNWPDNPEPVLARSASALRDALRAGSTRVVYYYGLASENGLLFADGADASRADANRVEARRADAQCVAWSDLAGWLGPVPAVDLLFLNLLGEAAQPALACGVALLRHVKAAVLVQCTPRDRAHAAARSGSDWLAAVFGQRLDPVQALYRERVGTLSAWTRYATWQLIRPARLEHPDLVKLLLDRHQQRNALTGARDDFYTYQARTIHHVVALGTPGCLTNEFPAMIRQHLVGNPRDAQREVYFHQAIDLPFAIGNQRTLDLAVRRRFSVGAHERLLARLLDRERLTGATFAFLILGWRVAGVRGDAPGFVAAAEGLLRALADWCRDPLGRELAELAQGGTQVRVISIVALESEHVATLDDTLDDLIDAYGSEQRFHFDKLDRLAAVSLPDLRKYFRNPEICTCDERYREQFPALLLGGRREMPFDEAVSTIRRGDPDNWANLFDELTDLTASKDWPPAHYQPNFWSTRDGR